MLVEEDTNVEDEEFGDVVLDIVPESPVATVQSTATNTSNCIDVLDAKKIELNVGMEGIKIDNVSRARRLSDIVEENGHGLESCEVHIVPAGGPGCGAGCTVM